MAALTRSRARRPLAILLGLLLAALPVVAQAPPEPATAAGETRTSAGQDDAHDPYPPADDAADGRLDGARAGAAAGNRAGSICLWTSLGLLLNLIGVGIALAAVPSPNVSSLLGHSSAYAQGYISSYRAARRTAQFRWAAIGCGVAVLLVGTLAILAANDIGRSCDCMDPYYDMVECCETGMGCYESGNECLGTLSSCGDVFGGVGAAAAARYRGVVALNRLGLLEP